MTHACHARACRVEVPTNIFMCARHWRMVPRPLGKAISDGWSMGGGSQYRANCDEAIRVVAAAEGELIAMPGIEPGMKALTVWQPWASLIMIGAKPYEFRKWAFTDRRALAHLVGKRIVIHAGTRAMKAQELEDILQRIDEGESGLAKESAERFVTASLLKLKGLDLQNPDLAAPLGAALGTVIIGEPRKCTDIFKNIDSDRIDHRMYGWPMIDPQPFPKPIPSMGEQGFWNWS